MITDRFHVILIISVLFYLLLLLKMLKEHVTILKYTLLWIAAGVVLSIFVVFPQMLSEAAKIFGIYSGVNFLFSLLIAFMFVISFSLTHIVSKLNENNKRLLQHLAILEKKIRDIENNNER